MEYASSGELYTRISSDGRLPESEARLLFAQIVSAVEHMVSDEDERWCTDVQLLQSFYSRFQVQLYSD